ncbi:MAG: GyrI-like domain-containing protein [Planctomycetota bacterium]|jgi:predicted transcriptional regulator YdeE|nr:GyrI-like domain-containing protein [Planctomycetota bacterium]
MTPEIVDRDEFIVVGVRAVLEVGALATGALWREQFFPRKGEVAGVDRKYYGVFNFPSGAGGKPGRCEYVAGVARSLDSMPEGMVGWVIPSGKYARIHAAGLPGISPACRDLIAEWLPDSGFKRTDSPIVTCTAAEVPDSAGAEWEIYVPVETPEEVEYLKKWGLYHSSRRFFRDENGVHEIQ